MVRADSVLHQQGHCLSVCIHHSRLKALVSRGTCDLQSLFILPVGRQTDARSRSTVLRLNQGYASVLLSQTQKYMTYSTVVMV